MNNNLEDFVFNDVALGEYNVGEVMMKYIGNEKVVSIPECIKIININTFYDNETIEEIIFNGDFKIIEYSDFGSGYFEYKKKMDIVNLKKVTFASYVDTIPAFIFSSQKSLKEIYIEGCNKIGTMAFYSCENLNALTIKSVKIIDNAAFQYCKIKGELVLPKDVRIIGNEAFSYCELSNVIFNEGLEILGKEAFSGNKLQNVELPSSVRIVGYCCFGDNKITNFTMKNEKIEWLNYSDNIDEIANDITGICIDDDIDRYDDYFNRGLLAKAVISEFKFPKEVEKINTQGMFWGCNNIKNIILPNYIHSINYNMFYQCTSLEKIEVLGDIKEIHQGAFNGCTSLKDISMFENVEVLDVAAFENSGIESVKVSDKIFILPNYIFSQCKDLKEVSLPENLCAIGNGCFEGCENITEIEIPHNVYRIGKKAFGSCTNLQTVTLHENVKIIENGAFEGCKSLKQINFTGTSKQWDLIKIESGNNALIKAIPQNGKKKYPVSSKGRIKIAVKFEDKNTFVYNCLFEVDKGSKVKVSGLEFGNIGTVTSVSKGKWANGKRYMQEVIDVLK